MSSETKISRGNLTVVPKEIRESLGVRPGDSLEWSLEGDRAIVRRWRKRWTVDDITAIIAVGGDAVADKKQAGRGRL
jgi:AbrB family looped-hinge helix DNA binding protein